MMRLTNEDLQAIGQLLDIRLKSELQPIKEDISGLKEDVAMLKEDVAMLKEDVAMLKEDVAMLKEDVAMLKEDVSDLKEDISGLKEDVESLKVRQTRIDLTLENEVCRGINILRENYLPAAERYGTAVSEIDDMKSDIELLKTVVEKHSEKLHMLGV